MGAVICLSEHLKYIYCSERNFDESRGIIVQTADLGSSADYQLAVTANYQVFAYTIL